MALSYKTLISIIFFLVSALGFSQNRDTTIVSIDTVSGIKKIIRLTFEGVNYTEDGGKMAKTTKRNISKFDKTGKLIYKSDIVSTMKGCVRSVTQYKVISIDKSGSYKTLKRKKEGKYIIKSFDKNGKLIDKKEEKYVYATWLDADEKRFDP